MTQCSFSECIMDENPRIVLLERAATAIRKELNNLRKQVESLRYMVRSEVSKIREVLVKQVDMKHRTNSWEQICHSQSSTKSQENASGGSTKIPALSAMAIGMIRTCFKEKNGTPKQPTLCPRASGSLTLEVFSNPSHSLEGLREYSHVWLLFVFHKNSQDSVKAKVRPPRLDGRKVGVFASRSPHRPCPIGLTLTKLERVENDTLHVSGIDLIDGTPILDVKPYIPAYDYPFVLPSTEAGSSDGRMGGPSTAVATVQSHTEVRVASWLKDPPVSHLQVEFLPRAEEQLTKFKPKATNPISPSTSTDIAVENSASTEEQFRMVDWYSEGTLVRESKSKAPLASDEETKCQSSQTHSSSENHYFLDSFGSADKAKEAIVEMLQQDPRSVYRRNKCKDQLYKVSIDNLNLTCWFQDDKVIVEDVQPKVLWERGKQEIDEDTIN